VDSLRLALNDVALQDSDADGLNDGAELRIGSDPLSRDSNGDGISDGTAIRIGEDATSTDVDGDGVDNTTERSRGTDPFRPDTDGDGLADGVDCFPLDPTLASCTTDPADQTPPSISLQEPVDAIAIP
jgi:hypothetical protein